jgi:hypothetical protein
LAGPLTAYVYDWNMLPMGRALWLKELVRAIATSIDPISNDGDLPLGNTLRTCSISAKVGSSQIPQLPQSG